MHIYVRRHCHAVLRYQASQMPRNPKNGASAVEEMAFARTLNLKLLGGAGDDLDLQNGATHLYYATRKGNLPGRGTANAAFLNRVSRTDAKWMPPVASRTDGHRRRCSPTPLRPPCSPSANLVTAHRSRRANDSSCPSRSGMSNTVRPKQQVSATPDQIHSLSDTKNASTSAT